MNDIASPVWIKSSRCSSSACVEVAKVRDQFPVRDSKSPDMVPLSFTEDEWGAFVEGVNAGEFRL